MNRPAGGTIFGLLISNNGGCLSLWTCVGTFQWQDLFWWGVDDDGLSLGVISC